MNLNEQLKLKTMITDGAMGTYYAQLALDLEDNCEKANISKPELIADIHRQYIDAGAQLIRTNTFAANIRTLDTSMEEVELIIRRGCSIAKSVAKDKVAVGASIGPIPEFSNQGNNRDADTIKKQYEAIIDVFLDENMTIFIFETFGSYHYLKDISAYIKKQEPKAFILTQFALNADGKTRKGMTAKTIVEEAEKTAQIDAYGFNCGVGPTHLLRIIKKLPKRTKPLSMLPNAGYPAIINERTVYTKNPEYFGRMMREAKALGIDIIGGCCGTTPEHIKQITKETKINYQNKEALLHAVPVKKINNRPKQDKKSIMVELAPPSDINISKTIEGAKKLKQAGVTMVTVPDSPMAKMRANSMLIAAKIQREAGITAMPHICCRDQNIISLKGSLLSGYIEKIRNVLVVTGDPIPEANRGSVKSVFNLNSYQLTQLIKEMNNDLFEQESINIACALNLNVKNIDAELNRMKKKIEYGASLFLTQPIFEERAMEKLVKLQKNKIRLFAGLMPVVTYRNAQFINNELPGIHIPKKYVDKFHPEMTRQEAQAVGVSITQDIATKIRPYVDGFYLITPFKRYTMMEQIVKNIQQKC